MSHKSAIRMEDLVAVDVCACAQIYTHRADVDNINAQQLARCGGERIVFAAQDVGSSEALAACLVRTAKHLEEA